METKADQHIFQCNLCSKEYTSKGSLTSHMRAHSGERPYVCQLCKKSFSRSAYLSVHMKIHTGEKPHECHVCGRSFIQKGNLVKHIRNHTGEKPHICQVCEKSFAGKDQLQIHMHIHTGERPFSCTECDKRFSHPGSLHSHMKIHIGERPFVCPVCNKSFIRKQDLQNHVRGVHKRSFPCAYISKGCGRIKNLNYHASQEDNNLKATVCKNYPPECVATAVSCETQDLYCQSNNDNSDGEKELVDIVNPTEISECFSPNQERNSLVRLESPSLGIMNKSHCEWGGKTKYDSPVDVNNQVNFPSVTEEPEVNIIKDEGDHITIVIDEKNTENVNNSEEFAACKLSSHKSKNIPGKDSSSRSTVVPCSVAKTKRKRKSRRHKCSVCQRKFISTNSLNLHVRKKHPEWHKNISECIQNASGTQIQKGNVRKIHCCEKSLFCVICNKEQKADLHSHKECFSCEFCGKSFGKQYLLNVHKQKHSCERPYECLVCQKNFPRKGNLLMHMKIHTNEKPFVCDTCRKSSSLKNNLPDHMVIQMEERPYVCLTCGKGFKRPPQLVSHAKVHSVEQSHVCTICYKTFKNSSSKKRHMKTHSSVNEAYKEATKKLKDVQIEFGNDDLSDCVKIELGVHANISSSFGANNGNHFSVISHVKTDSRYSHGDTNDFFRSSDVQCLVIELSEDIVHI